MFLVVASLARTTLRAPRALALFAAPLRTAPRARGLATAPPPLVFYVKRACDAAFAGVEVPSSSDVSTLVKATLAELRLDVPPTAVTLALAAGGAPPLDATLALDAALATRVLAPLDKLIVTVHDAAALRPTDVRGTARAAAAAADARAAELARALRDARATPLADAASGSSLVMLPRGVGWPQLGAAPLFVRAFYDGFYEGVLAECDKGGDAKLRRVTITGNAGIGKSAFGAYVMWRAVAARRAVVYVSAKEPRASIFYAGDGGVETCLRDDYFACSEALLGDPSTVLICDGVAPPAVTAFTLLITSPKRKMWKTFDQLDHSRCLFFPAFSRREIADMLRSCFPHLLTAASSGGEDGVWARFDAVGGVPRYVLNKVDDDLPAMLRQAVSRALVENLEDYIGDAETESEHVISHRLVRIKPAGEVAADALEPADASTPHVGFVGARLAASYAAARTELASPLAAELVVAEAARRRLRSVRSVLAAPPKAVLGKLYGDLFEPAARQALAAGGEFLLWNLTEGRAVGPLVLAPSTVVSFASAAALADAVRTASAAGTLGSMLFKPRSGNLTAVDAVIGRNAALCNFTVNLGHTALRYNKLRTEGIEPVADAVGIPPSGSVDFYWVLPPSRFAKAREQGPFVIVDAPPGANARRVVQFALCVSFE
jgi:hypothetical protein